MSRALRCPAWCARGARRKGMYLRRLHELRLRAEQGLLKAARVAWHLRTASRFDLDPVPTVLIVNLGGVMAGARQAIEPVYAFDTPDVLAQAGVEFFVGSAHFEDRHTLMVGGAGGSAPINFWCVPALILFSLRLQASTARANGHTRPCGTRTNCPSDSWYSAARQRQRSSARRFADSVVRSPSLSAASARSASPIPRPRQSSGKCSRRKASASGSGPIERVREENGSIVVTDHGESIEGALLLAVGRRPVVDGLDLERSGVKFSERGLCLTAM
jgi:hypothetical protein